MLWNIILMEYYTVCNWTIYSYIQQHVSLANIMLNEISQEQKNMYCDFFYIKFKKQVKIMFWD